MVTGNVLLVQFEAPDTPLITSGHYAKVHTFMATVCPCLNSAGDVMSQAFATE